MNKGILYLIIGVLISLNFGASSVLSNEITDDYFDIAQNYYDSNNFAKSLEYLDYILKIEPNNKAAIDLRIKIAPPAITKDVEPEVIEKVLTTNSPENFVILNVPQADIEKMSYDAQYYNKKGQDYYKNKDYNTAIEYFYKSIRLNKNNASAYNNLGMAYWAKNNTKLAIKYFKKSNRISRGYTQPLVNLAILYKQIGNTKKQNFYLNKATHLNRNDYFAYYLIAEQYRGNNDYKNAVENYKEVIKINPKYPETYLGLGICFFETEQFNYSLMSFNQYLDKCPNSDLALYFIARNNLILLRYDEAKIAIQKAIELNNIPEHNYELAKIEYYQENYTGALEILNTLVKSSANAELFNYAGLCNYKIKNTDAAIANFNKAVEIDGLRPIYYYNLAQCYKSLGDKKNFLKYINTAVKINPINYQDFIDLSYIYADNNNISYAINTLNNAIKCYPDVKALYLSKLKIYEAVGDNLNYNSTKDIINKKFNESIKAK